MIAALVAAASTATNARTANRALAILVHVLIELALHYVLVLHRSKSMSLSLVGLHANATTKGNRETSSDPQEQFHEEDSVHGLGVNATTKVEVERLGMLVEYGHLRYPHSMNRRRSLILCAVVWLCAGCGADSSPAKQRPSQDSPKPSESSADKYARLMEVVVAQLEKDVYRWSERDFKTQAEAMKAIFELSPLGPNSKQHVKTALREVGMSSEWLVEFTANNPEVVKKNGEELGKRLAAALEKVKARAIRFGELPLGDMEAVTDKAMREAVGSALTTITSPRPMGDWVAVASIAELRETLAQEAGRPVIIHFRAAWAVPTLRLEREVYNDPRVKDALRGYSRIIIDVSANEPQQSALQAKFSAESLPAVLIFSDSKALGKALEGPLPKHITIQELAMDVDSFLMHLPKSR